MDKVTTNMYVSDLANTDKLIEERRRIHYGDPEPQKLGSCMDDDDDVQKIGHTMEQCDGATVPHDVKIINDNNGEVNIIENNGEDVKKNTEEQPEVDEYESATPAKQKMMKLDMLRKLVELRRKGVTISQNYNMESDYKVMKYEYELHENFRNKHIGVKLMQDFCSFAIGGIEYANKSYDPFGLKLDGWGDAVNSDPDQIYDVFGGLYDKYGGVGGSSPEMRLIQILTFSAFKVHMAHKMTENTPDLKNLVNQNPAIISQLRPRAIGNRMAEQAIGKETQYTEKEAKEYQKVVDEAKDFQKLILQEEEARTQPQMKPPAMKRRMEMTSQGSNHNTSPITVEQLQVTREMTQDQYDQFVAHEQMEHQEYMKQLHDAGKKDVDNVSKYDNVSQQSSVVMNMEMDKIIGEASAEITSQTSKKKQPKQRRKKKQNTVVELDL